MPSGHGELVTEPPLDEWANLARHNATAADAWEFEVAGVPVRELRVQARRTLLETAAAATARMGLDAATPGPGPIIMTGHQPDLYHAGIWIKDFLVQRVAEETGGTGVDVVVDTDSFDWVGMTAPCLDPGISRCRQYLAIGGRDSCYACTPVPSPEHLEDFCSSTAAVLESLPAPAIGHHFATFCNALRQSVPHSRTLSEFVTGARRRFEGDATSYLELPVTEAARTYPFRRFAVDILLGAERFARAHNDELAEYRALNRIRSEAQPFPDLETAHSRIEVPFWILGERGRVAAYTRSTAAGVELHDVHGPVTLLPHDADAAVAALEASGVALVPRALTLTLFVRTFLADLFIHGIGGDRYDRITDALAERLWGVRLPPFVVASLTMYLPLGAAAVSDEDLSAIDRRLHRLAHNPDEVLGEMAFDSISEQRAAVALAEEKRALVAAISKPGADRKELGARIRSVNEQLSALVEPLVESLTSRREALERQRRDAEVLTDRTYPFCLWSPAEVADKVL
jgi:hypothetical protein